MSLCGDTKDQIISDALASYQYLIPYTSINSDQIIKDAKNFISTRYWVYPCNVIDLRDILKHQQIKFDIDPGSLLALRFAEKYFFRYNLFIFIDSHRIPKPDYNFNGIKIYNEHLVDVTDAILRVSINHPVNVGTYDIVRSVVNELSPGMEVLISNRIPGIGMPNPKLANKEKNVKMAQVPPKSELPLNEVESNIFSLLKNVKAAMNLPTDFRVAGGWVRDKLLGTESDDIDIAVSMPGYDVALAVQKFAQENNIPNVGKAFRVSLEKTADPKSEDQSQDLMVGGIPINGLKVEFVPMRTETYDEGSRTPKITLTDDVSQDALRRDLTINALYYNVGTGEVEDYVGGKEDLQNMNIKTPDNPLKTFKEDPLRMLRAIRFFTKYPHANLDPALMQAMKSPETHEAYMAKVHPSRASKELRKIFSSDKAVEGAKLLFETDMYKPVFQIPEDWHHISLDQQNPHHELSLMNHTLEVMKNFQETSDYMDLPEDQKMLMMMSTFTHDFLKMHPEIRKAKTNAAGETVMFNRNGQPFEHMTYHEHDTEGAKFIEEKMKLMGFPSHEREFVSTIVSNHMSPHDFENNMRSKDMGKFLNTVGERWKDVMNHAKADAISKGNMSDEQRQAIIDDRNQHMQTITEYRERKGDMVNKPLLDGNRIKEVVQQIDPEMAAKNARIAIKDDNPTHYIKYLTDRLLQAQWADRVNTEEEAEVWLTENTASTAALWRQQNSMPALPKTPQQQAGRNLLINGKDIMNIVPEIHPSTGFMQEVVDYIKDLQMNGQISTPEEAQQKVLEWKNVNLNRYTTSSNWYARTK